MPQHKRYSEKTEKKTLLKPLNLTNSPPLYDGKIQIFWHERVPHHQICSFYISLTPCYQSAQKSIQMLFSFGQTCKNAEYSWWDQAHLLQRTLVHEWQIVSRSNMSMPTNLPNSQFCQYTVLRYWQGLSLLSPLWWAQTPSKRPKTQKNCVISNI